jgi:hypothetical protein
VLVLIPNSSVVGFDPKRNNATFKIGIVSRARETTHMHDIFLRVPNVAQRPTDSPSPIDLPTPSSPPPTHRLDTLLTTIQTHALLHPNLVTRFDLLPVEIPWPNTKKKPQLPKESMHDILLLVKFRSAQAREAFIATRGVE